ncbi:MAG: hypothetical protein A3J25_17455 [Pseudomonadales bacterium RIFCSPLOWO2_02_FULL_63_210]|nr:MAG: hypothetical protein A3J25_17455 [Pseudomonadales bacterium RIFCSPLOWO2_02_FULL_63_210]
MNTPGKPLRWISLPCPWALWAAASRRQFSALVAWWHSLLPDEAIALLQFPPHLGQRPDFAMAVGYSPEPADYPSMAIGGSAAHVPLVKQNDNLPGEQQP